MTSEDAANKVRAKALPTPEPMSDRGPSEVTVFVCGGKTAEACPAGGQHDDLTRVEFPGGESVACSKCGSTAYERDLLRLP